MLGWIIPGSTWIGAAGTSAIGPRYVGADLGQGVLQKTSVACVIVEFEV